MAFSSGHVVESSDTDTLLAAIVEEGRNARFLVTWNLGYDAAAVLKPFIEDNVDALNHAHFRSIRLRWMRARVLNELEIEGRPPTPEERRQLQDINHELSSLSPIDHFQTPRHEVRIIGSKGFGVRPRYGPRAGRRYVWTYDAGAFYQSGHGHMSLDSAARTYLDAHKSDEELGIDRAAIGTDPLYYDSHRDAIIQYCRQDAELTARLMEHTITGVEALGIPFPCKPYSSGSIAKSFLDNLPDAKTRRDRARTLDDILPEAAASFMGGVFLLLGAGSFDHPYITDINSAYPYAMSQMPSLTGAQAIEYGAPGSDACFYRWYRIKARPCLQLPLRERGIPRKIYAHDGEEREWVITGPDHDLLRALGHPFTVMSGVALKLPSDPEPAFPWIRHLYVEKARLKQEKGAQSAEYGAVKLILNSMYGVHAQTRPRRGRYTSMIIASYTTALCRQQLWLRARAIEDAGDRVVMLATDGIIAVGDGYRATALAGSTTALGGWETTEADRIVAFESGVYCIQQKDRWSMKVRGLPGLVPETLQNCNEPSMSYTFESPLRMRQSIIERRPEDLGIWEDHTRELYPARAAENGGLQFEPSFASAPLKDYFERSWWLLPQGAPHAPGTYDGAIFGGVRQRMMDRALTRSSRTRGRPSRSPLHPLSLTTMIRLGAEP